MPWHVDARLITREPYTGRMGSPTGRGVERYPPEDPAEGCPAGWRRAAFVLAVSPYLRMRAHGGARVSNPLLDACTDPAILQAVLLFEREQELCIAHTTMVEAHAEEQERARRAEQGR